MASINQDPFTGKLVRLTATDPQQAAELFHRWNHNSEYQHYANGGPAWLYSSDQMKKWIEGDQSSKNDYCFMIDVLAENKTIGNVCLEGTDWISRNCWVGIGIGEPEYWGRGFGTEAMQLAVRFAFEVLNLHRVTLTVFDFNKRGIRSYEKAGFRVEGRAKGAIHRNGQRYDTIYMGILRADWEMLQYVDEDEADRQMSAVMES